MRRYLVVFALLFLTVGSALLAQKAADPTQRYFRLICLVHLTGSGNAGDPVVPEYIAQGTAVAQASMTPRATQGAPVEGGASPAPMSSRPGILAWSMQMTDDKTMAIIQVVAADRAALSPFLGDKRQEVRVFEIGKDKKETIEAELRKYKKDFDLTSFQVVAQ